MARLPAGIAIAAAVHAVLILWWTSQSVAEHALATQTPSITIEEVPVEVVPVAPPVAPPPLVVPRVAPPVQVAVLDTPAVPPRIAVPIPPRARPQQFTTSNADLPPTGDHAGSNAGSATRDVPPLTLGMRAHDHDLTLHPHDDDPLTTGVPVPADPASSGQLQSSGGGHQRSDQGAFVVDVDRDGNAHITNKSNAHLHLPGARDIGKAIGAWAADPSATGRDPEKEDINNNRAHDVDTRPDQGQATVGLVSGGFDVSDALMRRHGQDPYASQKLKVLDATRDERAAVGAAHRKDALKHATQLMQGNLAMLWNQTADPRARRAGLFALWDECAETGDADLIAGGQAARSMVIGFIRAKFPAGGAEAYTGAELAQLNGHKQSKATFAPYP